jgi:hypothetical protein
VFSEENAFLIAPFTLVELQKAILQTKQNKVAGPNGFPVEIYQNFWDIIKANIMELFGALHARQLKLFKLNSREIILLPKTKEAEWIQYYRPKCGNLACSTKSSRRFRQ